MKANRNLKSAFAAAMLSLALAFGMTAGQAIVMPDTAQAGVIGSIKSAAKSVGGGVKRAAVTVGSAGKVAGVAVGTAGKRAGVGVGRGVKDAAVAVARSPVGTGVKQVGKTLYVDRAASAVKKAVINVVR